MSAMSLPEKSLFFAAFLLLTFCGIQDVLAGPSYRRLVTSNPAVDTWSDGLRISIEMDRDRCKREYGDSWYRECSAPPAGQEGQQVSGVTMTPAVRGVWRWLDGETMRFEPEARLAPNTAYAISLEKVSLPSRYNVAKDILYRTQPQAVRIDKETLWIDPSAKGEHVLSVPVHFIWPVAQRAEMEKNITLAPQDAKSGLKFAPPTYVWNEGGDQVVLNARIIALPVQDVAAQLTITGLPSFQIKNGRKIDEVKGKKSVVSARMSVTGTDRLMDVSSIEVSPVYDENLGREYQVEVHTRLQAKPVDVLRHLDLVLLPRKSAEGAGQDCNWAAMPAIGAEDIEKGEKLEATLLQPGEEPATVTRLRIPAEGGRGLMAAMRTGLSSTGGMTLNRVRRFIINVPKLNAEINFLQPGNILALGAEQKLDIHSLGLTSFTWRAQRVREPFLAMLAAQTGFVADDESQTDYEAMTDAVEGKVEIAGTRPGEPSFTALDPALFRQGAKAPGGLLRLTLTGYEGETPKCEASRLLLLTNLGLMYKTAADGSSSAFVRLLSSGEPAQNVDVRLLGVNGLPVLAAKTDKNGRADLPASLGLTREKRPVAVVAVSGEDMAWLSLSESSRRVDYSNFAVSGRHSSAEGLSASVFTQRGLYLPGEMLHFGCIVRRFDWQNLAGELPLTARLYAPSGALVMRKDFSVGKDGLATLDWKSEEDSPAGAYRLDVSLASGEKENPVVLGSVIARVEEFQPDTLALRARMQPEAPKGWIRTGKGEKAAALVRLDNLYGEPAAGHRIKASFSASPATLRFPGYEDFVFSDMSSPRGELVTIPLPDAYTDKNGEASLSLPLEALRPGTSSGSLLVEGFELGGGRAVTRSLQAFFSPRSVVMGYKPENGANNLDYVPQNAKAALRLILLNNNLEPVAQKGLSVILSARRYVNSLVSDATGAYRYDATAVDTELSRKELNLEANGTSWPLPTDTAGEYLVTVRDSQGDLLASIPYNVAGERLAMHGSADPDALARGSLRLGLEKDRFASGDTIHFRISAPFAGMGLVTIERENVVNHAWFKAEAGESVQKIDIPGDFEGRGYVNVSFVRSPDSHAVYMNPHVFAVAPFTAGIAKRDMGLALKAPETVKPGEKVTVRVSSRLPGRVQLFAVDEGVLQLTNFATPNPLVDLLTDRSLDVVTRQAFDLLMPDHARLRGRIPGFGGGMGGSGGRFLNPFKRKNEPPMAFWSPLLDVTEAGRDVTFTVPEYFSGSVRIMAVGSAAPGGAPSAVGSAQASAKVRGTLILKPQLPLTVTPGDTFEGALVVGNTVAGSGKGARIALRMECPVGLSLITGQREQHIEVDENGEKAVVFRLRAEETLGEATVRFLAKIEGAGETVRAQSISIRPAGHRLRTERGAALSKEGAAEFHVTSERDMYPHEARTSFSLAAAPILALRSLMERLDSYPYGCTEQSISRAMPFVALWNAPQLAARVMVGARYSAEDRRKRAEASVGRAIGAIRASLDYDGVSSWPHGGQTTAFLTAYAADFLVTMRESGMAVPEGLARDVLDALERLVNRTPVNLGDGRAKIYGAWVLLRDGRVMTGALTMLEKWFTENTNHWEQDVLSALLADGFATLRLKKRARERLPKGDVQAIAEGDGLFSTGVARALYGLILHRNFSDRSASIPMQALLDMGFNTDASTLDMAMAARTLAVLAKDTAPDASSLKVSCSEYAPGFGDAGTDSLTKEGGMLSLQAPGCRRFTVSGQSGAEKGLYWLLAEEGFERKPPQAASNGLEVGRSYLDASNAPVTAAKLGDVLTVRVCGRALGNSLDNVVILDLVPGGLEPVLEKDAASADVQGLVRYERREDRGIFFVSLTPEERCFTYRARAATRGRFNLPAVQAEAMYEPSRNAVSGGGALDVR